MVIHTTVKKVAVGGLMLLALGLAALGGVSVSTLQGSAGVQGVYADEGCDGVPPRPDLDCPGHTPTPTPTPVGG
ncbi:MAG TPA: hypothetical protein VEX13_09930 [Chloroflexia bacterium]|nr:hypothetical protein [Chloroflexia bacterium]